MLPTVAPKYLSRVSYRELDASDGGPCYVFDVDKTYLDTNFSSLAGLLRMPLEVALDKRPYPGVPILIRSLQRGSRATGPDRPTFFLSASPKQMLRTLERRLVLDEIALDGVTLKDWRVMVKLARTAGLTNQVGYKLAALLLHRLALPQQTFDILFGDNSEADPVIYDAYSRIVDGSLRGQNLEHFLRRHEVVKPIMRDILELSEQLPSAVAPVHAVYIHRVSARTESFPRTTYYDTPITPSALLYREGLVSGESLGAVVRALRLTDAQHAEKAWHQALSWLPSGPDWSALVLDQRSAWPEQKAEWKRR